MIRNAFKAATVAIAAAALVSVAGCASNGSTNSTASAMQSVKTAEVGKLAPDFTLVDLDGTIHTLSDYTEEGKVVVIEWFNPGCPFVKKHYKNANRQTMNELASEYKGDGVVWLAINSGAPGKQGHGFEMNSQAQSGWGMDRPILLDETGKVGRLYNAQNTPEMFVVDGDGIIRYHGAIDNDRSAASIGNVNYVKNAVDSVLAGGTVEVPTTRPYGCSVKY